MPSLTSLVIELLVLGATTGFLAGLLGIGGGMILVPFLAIMLGHRGVAPDYLMKIAVATSLACICLTSLASVRAHHRHGAVLWPVVLSMGPGIVVGSLLGSQFALAIPPRVLSLVFAVFLGFTSIKMLLAQKPNPRRNLPGKVGLFGAGLPIGAVAAVLGAGGAFLSVPFMTRCNVKIHNAVATSAALGFPIAVGGTMGYVIASIHLPHLPPGSLGFVYVPALLAVSLSSVVSAPIGARLAHSTNTAAMRKIFALLLFGLAVHFALR